MVFSSGFPPLAFRQFVTGLNVVSEAEIGFPFCPALALRVLESNLADILTIDGRHTGPNQWREFRDLHVLRGEILLHLGDLMRLYIDHELVGGITWQTVPPGFHQVVSDQGQKHQYHQPESKGDHLDNTLAAAPVQIGKPISPGNSGHTTKPACGFDQ